LPNDYRLFFIIKLINSLYAVISFDEEDIFHKLLCTLSATINEYNFLVGLWCQVLQVESCKIRNFQLATPDTLP